MKNLLFISFAAILMLSCNKNIESYNPDSGYLNNIKAGLKDSLNDNDLANIDFSKAIITDTYDGRSYLRIPFNGKKFSEEFVLLKTDSLGQILQGFIIKLNQSAATNDTKYMYNGTIRISYLDRKDKLISEISNGYIKAFHRQALQRMMYVQPSAPAEVLPEVIVTCYINSGGSLSSYNSISLSSFFAGSYANSSSYNSSGYYNSMNGGGGGGSGNGGYYNENEDHEAYFEQQHSAHGGGRGQIAEDESELVDFEFVEDLSPIDVTKYLKCFSNIPDPGSTCSIEIFTDIPVDDNSNRLFNWRTQSPGHTFLQFKKTNGISSIVQNIGFYPVDGWKTLLTTAPVTGKIVDNSEHEYNASFKMYLTAEELKKTLDEAVYLARFIKYDIDEFNCTDFALDIFNTTRISNPLEIPKYDIPGGTAINGTNTPQGLYNKLKSMQQQGIESQNITISGDKSFVGPGNGKCD